MTLFPLEAHPHGMAGQRFRELFTPSKPVIFAFHGYQRAIHEIIHGRENAERFHVRGFNEQGTTTTPFAMVSLNGMSRYHLAIEAIRRSRRVFAQGPALVTELNLRIAQALAYTQAHFEDDPDITNWRWQGR